MGGSVVTAGGNRSDEVMPAHQSSQVQILALPLKIISGDNKHANYDTESCSHNERMLYSESPECQTKDGKPVKRYRDPLKTIEKMIKLAEKFQHDMYNVVFTSDFRDYPAEYKKRVY